MAKAGAGTRLENLWDEARANGMTEPEKLLYRSNLLGSDKRITNYGGGNTSAKVMERDPLTGETVEVLWVKGSGGDVGSIKLDGFATLYMDKLRALKGIYRGRRLRGRDGGLPAALHLQPEPARRLIDTPLHAYVPKNSCRSHAPRRDHRHRRLGEFTRADAAHLWRRDRLAALEAAGLRARACGWRNSAWTIPTRKAWCWKATDCSPGTMTPKRCYETTLRIINRAIDWFEGETAGKPPSAARACSRWSRRRDAAVAARLMPAIRGMISKDQPQGRPFRRQPRGAGIRQCEATWSRWRRWARPAPTISCGPRSGRWWWISIRRNRISRRRWPRLAGQVAAYRADYAAYYERCKHADSPPMRDPNAVVYLVPGRRHDHLRQGQGDGAHLGRVLRQRHQRDARRVHGVGAIAACRSRRPSTSNTGCWRKPSCSACRSRRALPAGSPSSPAAPAASGRPRRSASCWKAPAWCWPISTRQRLERTAEALAQRHGARRCRGRSAWT